nr:iron ABC transporter permease [Sorangium cellulosum]
MEQGTFRSPRADPSVLGTTTAGARLGGGSSAVLTAGAVALGGNAAFVGLLAPHALRPFLGVGCSDTPGRDRDRRTGPHPTGSPAGCTAWRRAGNAGRG